MGQHDADIGNIEGYISGYAGLMLVSSVIFILFVSVLLYATSLGEVIFALFFILISIGLSISLVTIKFVSKKIYDKISPNQNTTWVDFYTPWDPVPNGPFFEEEQQGKFFSVEVRNEDSFLTDHTTYHKNLDQFYASITRSFSSTGVSNIKFHSMLLQEKIIKRANWLRKERLWFHQLDRWLLFAAMIMLVLNQDLIHDLGTSLSSYFDSWSSLSDGLIGESTDKKELKSISPTLLGLGLIVLLWYLTRIFLNYCLEIIKSEDLDAMYKFSEISPSFGRGIPNHFITGCFFFPALYYSSFIDLGFFNELILSRIIKTSDPRVLTGLEVGVYYTLLIATIRWIRLRMQSNLLKLNNS